MNVVIFIVNIGGVCTCCVCLNLSVDINVFYVGVIASWRGASVCLHFCRSFSCCTFLTVHSRYAVNYSLLHLSLHSLGSMIKSWCHFDLKGDAHGDESVLICFLMVFQVRIAGVVHVLYPSLIITVRPGIRVNNALCHVVGCRYTSGSSLPLLPQVSLLEYRKRKQGSGRDSESASSSSSLDASLYRKDSHHPHSHQRMQPSPNNSFYPSAPAPSHTEEVSQPDHQGPSVKSKRQDSNNQWWGTRIMGYSVSSTCKIKCTLQVLQGFTNEK